MPPPKKPRRTAERILEVTLDLFNRFGEPNVSTTLISAELRISPGNLYYHYPAKDELINALFDRYERALNELLPAADNVANVEDAWLFLHMLFELVWANRFLYRDLNDLLSKNRRLETHFQFVLKNKGRAMQQLIDGLQRGGVLGIELRDVEPLATSMVVLATYWLSYEYVRDPRHALEGRAGRHLAQARRLPRAEPAAAAPGTGVAPAPAHAGRLVPVDPSTFKETTHGQVDRLPVRQRRIHLRRRRAEETLGAAARRRRRAAAEGRQGAGRLGAVPRRRLPEGL
jgi:AcrR family transcriptional regulator